MIRLKSAVLLVSGLGAVLVMLNVWNVKSIPPVPTPSNCPPKPTYAVLGKKVTFLIVTMINMNVISTKKYCNIDLFS